MIYRYVKRVIKIPKITIMREQRYVFIRHGPHKDGIHRYMF